MGLEKEIRDELNRTARMGPTTLRADVTGEPQIVSAMEMLRDYVVPMLDAQRDAILRLAGEVDNLT